MRKDEVKRQVEDLLEKLGAPKHVLEVKPIPSKTKASVIMDGQLEEFEFRSGITQQELNQKLKALELRWKQRVVDGQRDLEDFVA
jgi:hypothetical protein